MESYQVTSQNSDITLPNKPYPPCEPLSGGSSTASRSVHLFVGAALGKGYRSVVYNRQVMQGYPSLLRLPASGAAGAAGAPAVDEGYVQCSDQGAAVATSIQSGKRH